MPWTLIHTSNHLELVLQHRCGILSSRQVTLEMWRTRTGAGPEEWPATEAELADKHVTKEQFELSALKEIAQMTAVEKQCLDADIETGIQELASRFSHDPTIPEVPEHVWEQARGPSDELDVDYWEYWQQKTHPWMRTRRRPSTKSVTPTFGCTLFCSPLVHSLRPSPGRTTN